MREKNGNSSLISTFHCRKKRRTAERRIVPPGVKIRFPDNIVNIVIPEHERGILAKKAVIYHARDVWRVSKYGQQYVQERSLLEEGRYGN
jgi:hypothetical protein